MSFMLWVMNVVQLALHGMPNLFISVNVILTHKRNTIKGFVCMLFCAFHSLSNFCLV